VPSFVAIDFETANYGRDSACAIGLVKVERGRIVATEYRLIDPQDCFEPRFVGIHGIGPDDVADAPGFDVVWRELLPLLHGATFLAAHNSSFDESVLMACCSAYGIRPPRQPFLCTMRLAREKWRLYPTNLPAVCSALGIELDHHNAMSDALACAQIVLLAR